MPHRDPPPETMEELLFLQAAGQRIPAALTMPSSGDPRGAVVLVPGSLFLDVDGNMPAFNARPHAYADLARQLLGTRGLLVLSQSIERGPH